MLEVQIAGVNWKNPVTVASGTFSAREAARWYDPGRLGALTAKGVAIEAWEGNPTPRIAETWGGMLNAVGLQNPGVDSFIEQELPFLENFETPVIVNLAGHSIEEYVAVASRLNETAVAMLELNISCPNIKEGGIGFGSDPDMAARVTEAVRQATQKPLIVKLTPNVGDIAAIARAVENAGADAISMINTLLGMKIDVHNAKPVLANWTGGLSGPAIKPVAVRMVWQVRQAVSLPIIGMGGIMSGEDAVEFLMAGANAVAVGTAGLLDPAAPVRILKEIEQFMELRHYKSVEEIRQTGRMMGGRTERHG
ncbi:MAG TPA: dihydroorotate dehydrogenase [Clostridiales bacterium]|jgi:dihydroorotate dehydrogenase (NAD+) catalytic subunit|nr:dihydroorotate dehydrogenase [Clostridiales bacterium]